MALCRQARRVCISRALHNFIQYIWIMELQMQSKHNKKAPLSIMSIWLAQKLFSDRIFKRLIAAMYMFFIFLGTHTVLLTSLSSLHNHGDQLASVTENMIPASASEWHAPSSSSEETCGILPDSCHCSLLWTQSTHSSSSVHQCWIRCLWVVAQENLICRNPEGIYQLLVLYLSTVLMNLWRTEPQLPQQNWGLIHPAVLPAD